jgi:hypothetical protein
MVWRIGVDIGGTFTDVALVEEASGRIGVAKVPTNPVDLAEGVLRGLELAMSRYDVIHDEVGLLSHATTPSSRERGRVPRWLLRAASATCSSFGAQRAPTFTTYSRMRH